MKNVLITGSTSGIGKETAKLVVENGYKLIIVARNKKLIDELINELIEINENAQIDYVLCDFSDPVSMKKAALALKDRYKAIDYVYLNAGALPRKKKSYIKEVPEAYLVNYIGPRYFLNEIFPLILKSKEKTILYTVSMSSPKKYEKISYESFDQLSKIKAYGISKLLAANYLTNLKDEEIKVRLIDPRIVYTNATIKYLPFMIRFIHPLIKLVSRMPIKIAKEVIDIIEKESIKPVILFARGKEVKLKELYLNKKVLAFGETIYQSAIKKLGL